MPKQKKHKEELKEKEESEKSNMVRRSNGRSHDKKRKRKAFAKLLSQH